MAGDNTVSRDIYGEIYYDFMKQRPVVLVIGGYGISRRSTAHFVVNVIGLIWKALMYLYVLVAGVITIVYKAQNKTEMVQTFYFMGLIFVSIGFHLARVMANDSLGEAMAMIRNGVYRYDDGMGDEYRALKEKRMKTLKFFVAFISGGMYFCAVNFVVIIPLVQLTVHTEEITEDDLNPFLPMPFYVPFSTLTVSGFCTVYVLSALTLYTMYVSYVCHEEIFLVCMFQMTLQLDILNTSLRNMERRAYFKLMKKVPFSEDSKSMIGLYDNPDFQACLYTCLRENIEHHLTILRFKKAISPYIEGTTTVVVLIFSSLVASAIIIMMENTTPQLSLITDLFGFLPMCYVGQLIADRSNEVKNAIFDSPWTSCNEKIKVLVKVFMSNTQQPIMMKVKGLNFKLCLETFGDLISVGYKILNVLR